jgi:hypothetical protein
MAYRYPPKYHKLTPSEQFHFHLVRCLYHALFTWDTFEAYRQACIGSRLSRELAQ